MVNVIDTAAEKIKTNLLENLKVSGIVQEDQVALGPVLSILVDTILVGVFNELPAMIEELYP